VAPGVLASCDRQQVEVGPPSAVRGGWERRRVTSGSALSRTGGGCRSDKVQYAPKTAIGRPSGGGFHVPCSPLGPSHVTRSSRTHDLYSLQKRQRKAATEGCQFSFACAPAMVPIWELDGMAPLDCPVFPERGRVPAFFRFCFSQGWSGFVLSVSKLASVPLHMLSVCRTGACKIRSALPCEPSHASRVGTPRSTLTAVPALGRSIDSDRWLRVTASCSRHHTRSIRLVPGAYAGR